jgi:GNAT superfamily N-acetyltransferase
MHELASLDDIKAWCAPSPRFDPATQILFALGARAGSEPTIVGFSRLGWYTGAESARVYSQYSYLLPTWRAPGVWPRLVRQGESRLRELAAGHPSAESRCYQAWATASQTEWIAALEGEGYQVVRRFHNMVRRLSDLPAPPMPPGLEVRPVLPEHYRAIWEAQREVQPELFETVMEQWTEDRYPRWAADPSHTPQLWQIAWDGDQVAGMVLNRIDEAENAARGRKRGYTEHVFVRQPWRGRGLASALLARSLALLKAQGMEEAELGVDVENASRAHPLYERMGFRTFSVDLWFRKAMS